MHGLGISTHAPLAGCDLRFRVALKIRLISTHAPLAGCDPTTSETTLFASISTHAPLAGCDKQRRHEQQLDHISTHAPLAGCDSSARAAWWPRWRFQPTHPLRGATANMHKLLRACLRRQTNLWYFCPGCRLSGHSVPFLCKKIVKSFVRTAQVISAHLRFAL